MATFKEASKKGNSAIKAMSPEQRKVLFDSKLSSEEKVDLHIKNGWTMGGNTLKTFKRRESNEKVKAGKPNIAKLTTPNFLGGRKSVVEHAAV